MIDSETETALYRFQVQGIEQQKTFLPSTTHTFDETYDLEGEHPAEALGKLVGEIEWGILDGYMPFTIEFCGESPETR